MLEDKVRLLKAVTDNASVALLIMDERQQCVFMNPAAERLTGYTLDEVKGRALHDVIHYSHPDGRPYPLHECPIDRAFPERNRMQGEEVFVHKEGYFYEVAYTASPIRDDEGRALGTVIEVRDITESKRQQRASAGETQLLELLNETATLIGGELDLGPLLQRVTDAATKLTGAQFGAFFYNARDEQGEALQLYTLSGAPMEAFKGFGHPRATPIFGPTFRGQPVIRMADVTQNALYGQWAPHHGMPKGHLPVRSYLAVAVVSRRGEVIGGLFFGHPEVGVFTERSERLALGIAAQASVALDNARLYADAQRAMRQRDVLLDSERAARAEAESASRVKDQFLATLSHELRTPLSAVLGWLHILRIKGTSDPAILAKGLDIIERSASTQQQLIEDLLDMSRISTGKLHLDMASVDVNQFVAAAIELVQPSATAAGVSVTFDNAAGRAAVHGDPGRLQQVVWNLLSNAVKFTPRGGAIHVFVRRVGQNVQLAVRDTGMGIPAEFLPHLFDRFRQSDQSTTRRFGGLGLGLSLVQQLVRFHGGTVEAHSEGEGKGATFTVVLPLTGLPVAAPGECTAEAVPLKLVGRILVVEDDEAVREFLERLLGEAGAQVLSVANTGQARAALVDGPGFHLLISDIGLPGEDGYEFMQWVRRQPDAYRTMPSIALTAFARPDDAAAARRAGFDAHLPKPVDLPMLLRKAAELLR